MKKTLLSLSLVTMFLTGCGVNENRYIANIVDNRLTEKIDGYEKINDILYVNHFSGHYNDALTIEFKVTDLNYDLYYSLDGSYPEILDENLYQEPINIEKIVSNDLKDYPLTTSVDGVLEEDTEGKCVSTIYNNNIQLSNNYPLFQKQNTITIRLVNKETGETHLHRTLTYLIDDNEYDIPVISLTMPYEDWFDEQTGMYNNIRQEIEKRVYLEYFDFENDEFFSLNSKIKLGGNWTLGYPMRTLNLNFNKDENGNKNTPINIPIFKDRVTRGDRSKRLSNLTRFRLHSGGNAFEQWTGFNDAIIQNIMENSYVSTTGYRPCITYLNGEYWGLYYIREHYSDTYFKDNYGVDKDDVIFYELKGNFLLDDGDEVAGEVAINELLNFVNNSDFSKYEVYKDFINNYIDENSFIDLFVAEAYASNWDFVGNLNNLKMWRTSKVDSNNPYADGKWRFCLHDADFAFTEYTNFLNNNSAYPYVSFKMFSSLLKQEEFRNKFYNRTVELIENNFAPANACRVLDAMVDEVSSYKLDAMIRWGKDLNSYSEWLKEVNATYKYIQDKSRAFLATVSDSLKQFD